MKKIYFIAGAALLAAVSCSKNEVAPSTEPDWNSGDPVKVALSAPRIMVESKAVDPVTNLVEGESAAGLNVGVYGLSTADGILNWDPADETTYITSLVNRSAVVGEDGSINFDPAAYYPMSNAKTYSFYGYYPYVDTATNGADLCYADYDLTGGNVDILWDDSHATPFPEGGAQYGYNAAYIRRLLANNPEHQYLPSFSFRHMLTALRFVASPAEGSGTDNTIQVTGFELVDVVTGVRLNIASTDPDVSGTVEAIEGETGNLVATGADGEPLAVTPTEEGADIATFTLFPGNSYQANITLTVNGSEQNTISTPITTRINGGTFVAGTRYRMRIVITDLQKVEIKADVEPWEDVEGGDIEIG